MAYELTDEDLLSLKYTAMDMAEYEDDSWSCCGEERRDRVYNWEEVVSVVIREYENIKAKNAG